MANKKLTLPELIDSHKPKNFKYKFIIDNDDVLNQLINEGYTLDTLDTIDNDELTNAALQAPFKEFDRSTVAKAKQPTVLPDGLVLSKKMITKADKKLICVQLGLFDYNNINYVAIKFKYDLFDILEIFIMI